MRLSLIILAACTCTAALPAVEAAAAKARHPGLAALLDANGDGQVSREEFIAGLQKREAWIKANRPELYARLDANGDGTISRGEREALHERWHARNAGDRVEDRHDRREDRRDTREDVRDAKHDGGLLDDLEDALDTREDRRDAREDVRDHARGPVGGAGRR